VNETGGVEGGDGREVGGGGGGRVSFLANYITRQKF
jgi:hypothetical protein